MRTYGFGFGFAPGANLVRAQVVADALAEAFAAYEADSKLLSCWFLPISDPAADLILSGQNVQSWSAAYGTDKLDLAATVAPQWDPALFGGKGGVVGDGSTQFMESPDAPTGWPSGPDGVWIIAGVRQDRAGATAGTNYVLNYGNGTADRGIGRTNDSGTNRVRGRNGPSNAITGTSGDFSGVSSVAVHIRPSGADMTNDIYLGGVLVGSHIVVGSQPSVTLTRLRMFAGTAGSAANLLAGAIACAAVLPGTVSEVDALALDALMRSRVS